MIIINFGELEKLKKKDEKLTHLKFTTTPLDTVNTRTGSCINKKYNCAIILKRKKCVSKETKINVQSVRSEWLPTAI